MAADPVIYCLENLTDYAQFERLCHDLMASEGYSNIEPLGGMKDKGRDAIHVSKSNANGVCIFAYSVREDWRKKLSEDAEKIRSHGHKCSRLAFLCTASFSSSQRDEAVSFIERTFGWSLDLYGLERLRVLLRTKHERLLASHPQIFSPPFFPAVAGLSLSPSHDCILIDHADGDEALATWLYRRLTLAGYLVWCRSVAPTAGTSITETIASLVKQRAFRFVCVLSPAAAQDPDVGSRRAMALTVGGDRSPGFVIPVSSAPLDRATLDERTRQLDMIPFEESWRTGLEQLLTSLEMAGCPRAAGGNEIALRSYMLENLLSSVSERVMANRFPVLQIPQVIHRYCSRIALPPEQEGELSLQWAFRQVTPQSFLGFHRAPRDKEKELGITSAGGASWSDVPEMDGIATRNLVPELIRKSLIVTSVQKGLYFCKDRRTLYFPSGLLRSDRLYFVKPDGGTSFVNVVGKRKYWRPSLSSEYRYHLAPVFSVQRTVDGGLVVVMRVRVHLTDTKGTVLQPRAALSRRKHLCGDWWNEDWLHRTLAIMQFLAVNGTITCGDDVDSTVRVSAVPDEWTVPVSIDERAISQSSDIRKEILERAYQEDDFEESDGEPNG